MNNWAFGVAIGLGTALYYYSKSSPPQMLTGPWTGLGYAVTATTTTSSGLTIKFSNDGQETRMEGSDGTYRYFVGPIAAFDPAQWSSYNQG